MEEAAATSSVPIIYLQESRQGKSFALNRGLAHAHGDIVALTDDDVLPAREWLTRIVDTFRAHNVTFVFGKVLPRWGCCRRPSCSPHARRTSGGHWQSWTTATSPGPTGRRALVSGCRSAPTWHLRGRRWSGSVAGGPTSAR